MPLGVVLDLPLHPDQRELPKPSLWPEGASSTQEGGSWLCQAWVPLIPTPHLPKLPPVEQLPQGPPVDTSAGLRASPHVVRLESTPLPSLRLTFMIGPFQTSCPLL